MICANDLKYSGILGHYFLYHDRQMTVTASWAAAPDISIHRTFCECVMSQLYED